MRETLWNGHLAIAGEAAEPGYTDRGYTQEIAGRDLGAVRAVIDPSRPLGFGRPPARD